MKFSLPDSGIIYAPAKINLHLNITHRLADGRHGLDTSFAFVDSYDVLHIQAAKQLSVGCSIESLSGERNLVFQLLKAFQKTHHIEQGLDIFIDKQLPAEAGLGGGSSDAASALLAANERWGTHLSQQQLIDFATSFGADIPCFLFGKASLATGVGEQLRPYQQPMPSNYICLARPKKGLSTRAVFQYFDQQNNSHAQSPLTSPISADTIRAASQGKISVGENALEKSAIALLPEVASLLQAMRQQTNMAWMSGSGSSCIALCSTQQQASMLAEDLQHQGLATWTHAGKLLDKHPGFCE